MFIDFKAAYDSIVRIKLYEAMNEFNIPEKLIKITKMTMQQVTNSVRIQNNTSAKEFTTSNGLRQGDPLACLLFNIALEKVIRHSNITTSGLQI